MQETASGYFGGMAAEYDSLIRRAVPHYGLMHRRLLEHLPPDCADVLELGCGTGELSVALARRWPAARLTLVDASPEMLAVAGERVRAAAPGGERSPIHARFEDLNLPQGCADLVASAISLHHVADKAALYRAIAGWLRPGGWLVFADQFRGAAPETHQRHWDTWLAHCALPGHCSAAETQSLLDHAAAHDHYVPLAEHFDMLRTAGLTDSDCVWREGLWAIVVARRP